MKCFKLTSGLGIGSLTKWTVDIHPSEWNPFINTTFNMNQSLRPLPLNSSTDHKDMPSAWEWENDKINDLSPSSTLVLHIIIHLNMPRQPRGPNWWIDERMPMGQSDIHSDYPMYKFVRSKREWKNCDRFSLLLFHISPGSFHNGNHFLKMVNSDMLAGLFVPQWWTIHLLYGSCSMLLQSVIECTWMWMWGGPLLSFTPSILVMIWVYELWNKQSKTERSVWSFDLSNWETIR
jgi:hypothetical protein